MQYAAPSAGARALPMMRKRVVFFVFIAFASVIVLLRSWFAPATQHSLLASQVAAAMVSHQQFFSHNAHAINTTGTCDMSRCAADSPGTPLLYVIVPFRNRLDNLARMVSSLNNATAPADRSCVCVVVSDFDTEAPSGPSASCLTRRHPQLKIQMNTGLQPFPLAPRVGFKNFSTSGVLPPVPSLEDLTERVRKAQQCDFQFMSLPEPGAASLRGGVAAEPDGPDMEVVNVAGLTGLQAIQRVLSLYAGPSMIVDALTYVRKVARLTVEESTGMFSRAGGIQAGLDAITTDPAHSLVFICDADMVVRPGYLQEFILYTRRELVDLAYPASPPQVAKALPSPPLELLKRLPGLSPVTVDVVTMDGPWKATSTPRPKKSKGKGKAKPKPKPRKLLAPPPAGGAEDAAAAAGGRRLAAKKSAAPKRETMREILRMYSIKFKRADPDNILGPVFLPIVWSQCWGHHALESLPTAPSWEGAPRPPLEEALPVEAFQEAWPSLPALGSTRAGFWRTFGFGMVVGWLSDLQAVGGLTEMVGRAKWGKEDNILRQKILMRSVTVRRRAPHLVHLYHARHSIDWRQAGDGKTDENLGPFSNGACMRLGTCACPRGSTESDIRARLVAAGNGTVPSYLWLEEPDA